MTRVETIKALEKGIWNSGNYVGISQWDRYTDTLPLGNWEDINSSVIEISIKCAEDVLEIIKQMRDYEIIGRTTRMEFVERRN